MFAWAENSGVTGALSALLAKAETFCRTTEWLGLEGRLSGVTPFFH